MKTHIFYFSGLVDKQETYDKAQAALNDFLSNKQIELISLLQSQQLTESAQKYVHIWYTLVYKDRGPIAVNRIV